VTLEDPEGGTRQEMLRTTMTKFFVRMASVSVHLYIPVKIQSPTHTKHIFWTVFWHEAWSITLFGKWILEPQEVMC